MIKSEAEYEETLNMINELMDDDPEPDSDHGKLLEKLCLLIREYEENESYNNEHLTNNDKRHT